MVRIPSQQNHPFQGAAMMFDLERLKTDLGRYGKITPKPWDYFLGILSGYNQKEISEKFGVSEKTVEQALIQRGIRSSLIAILDLPEDDYLDWNRIPKLLLDAGYGLSEQKTHILLSQEIFKNMLDKQRKLTANPLINANFEASKLYVPLGLVESKKQERRKDVSPEMGSRLYRPEEYEVTRQFENDDFLTEVLLQGNSPKSQGKRIAIIGEPGSGKTTRLQQIADRLFNENDDNLVIWVSLADLQDRTLEDFLRNTWLKIALKQREASEVSQNELIEKFNEGNVWLLLDGLDEMVLDSNPLFWVNSQIKGWIESAKIILTCRVNVWESGNNYLSNFDVYRNLDFSELQRDEFIYKWFSDRNLANQLITELNQNGKERIRDLVKNPLRLTLICYSWENHQGSLPETKAGLYKECVEAFYQWKEVYFKTTITQRKALNQALGELAKKALEQESSKFRLTKSFICEVLGELDEGLFKLALDLGWLNRVGVAEESPNEQVYAFFHPSFQEYFASLAINDWTFFFHHDPNNLSNGSYKIFDKKWDEVLRLWISRKDIKESDKSEFINQLLSFTDHQKPYFYYYHTHLIVFSFILDGDLKESDYKITEKVLSWYFGMEGSNAIVSIRSKILELIKNHPSEYLIRYLEGLLLKNKNNQIWSLEIVDIFINIKVESTQVIQFLLEIFMQHSNSERKIYNMRLGKIISIKEEAEIILNDIYLENCLVREHFLPFYKKDLDIVTNKEVLARKILKLDPDDQKSREIIDNIERKRKTLLNVYCDKSSVHSTTKDMTNIVKNEQERYYSIWYYFHDELMPCKKDYVDNYHWNRFLKNNSYEQECRDFFVSLNDTKLINELAFFIEKTYDFYLDSHRTNYPELYELDYQSIYLDYELIISTLILSCEMLSLSENSHQDVLYIFEKIFEDSLNIKSLFNEQLMIKIGFYLARFSSEKLKYYNLLIQEVFYKVGIYQFNENHFHDDHDLVYEDFFLLTNIYSLMKKTLIKEPRLFSLTVQNLGKFLSRFDEVSNKDNDSLLKKTFLYSILWFCSENMSYSDFYEAWHSQPEIIHPEILEISLLGNTAIAQTLNQQILDLPSQLQATEKTYPLIINAQSLEDETENSSIAQELCNQIYAIAFPDEINIPEINNAPQLKRLIPTIKKQLGTKNLALIFHNGEPNETPIKFCNKLTDSIHIKWITEQSIKIGIPPQENLINILQNWINQLD